MITHYVISLATAAERREHMTQEFSKAGVPFVFFDAVTPATVEATAAALQIDLSETLLKPSELGCLLSHVAVWQKMLDEQLDYAAIFEDDIHLGMDAGAIMGGLEHWWPTDAKIVKLERFYPRALVSAHGLPIPGYPRQLYRLHEKHTGAGGYVLSQAAAAELMDLIRTYTRLVPIDHIIFGDYLEQKQAAIYQVLPALCIQDHILKGQAGTLPSQLSAERRVRQGLHNLQPLSLPAKARREVLRIKKQIQLLLRTQMVKLNGQRLAKMTFK